MLRERELRENAESLYAQLRAAMDEQVRLFIGACLPMFFFCCRYCSSSDEVEVNQLATS